MPVPDNDRVCRFIRPRDWSRRENRPRPGAFKQPSLSIWHEERLLAHGASLYDLRIEHLVGCGQAHHAAGDYQELASEAAQEEASQFSNRHQKLRYSWAVKLEVSSNGRS